MRIFQAEHIKRRKMSKGLGITRDVKTTAVE